MIHYAGIVLFYMIAVANSFVCYYPNGHSEQSVVYQPCPGTNGGTGMCCATNRTNPSGGYLSAGLTADMCLENGLCMNTHTNDDGTVSSDYWRDQCTVSDWSSGRCLDACTNGTDGSSDGTAQITPCDGTETSEYWCCGLNNTTCCDTPAAISIAADLYKSTSTSSSSTATSSTTTIASSSATQTNSATDAPNNITNTTSDSSNSSSGLSSGAKIGIGIGCGFGAALGAGLLLLYVQMQRKKRPKIMSVSGTRSGYVNQQPRELDSEATVGKSARDLVRMPTIRHELHAELASDT